MDQSVQVSMDVKERIKQAIFDWAEQESRRDPGDICIVTVKEIQEITISADPNRSMQITADGLAKLDPKYDLISMGTDTLSYTGTPPQQQKLRTHEFTKRIMETTTTATTNAFKVGGAISEKITASVKIPFIGEGKSETTVTVTGEYSWNRTDSRSVTEEVTYKMPSQEIVLNPGDKYELKALLYMGTVNGKTLLKMPVTGKVRFTYTRYLNLDGPDQALIYSADLSLGEFADKCGRKFMESSADDRDLAYLIGQGTVSVPYAVKTELELKKLNSSGQAIETTALETLLHMQPDHQRLSAK